MYGNRKMDIVPVIEGLLGKNSQQDVMEGLFQALANKTEFFANPKTAKKMIWNAYKEGNKVHLDKQDDEWEIIQEKEDVEEVILKKTKIDTLKMLSNDLEKKYMNFTPQYCSNTKKMMDLLQPQPSDKCSSPTINQGTQTNTVKTQASCSQTQKNYENFTTFITKKRDFTTQTFEIIKQNSYIPTTPPLSNRCQRILDTIYKKQVERERKLQTLNLVGDESYIPKCQQTQTDKKPDEKVLTLSYQYQPQNNGYQMEKYGWAQQLGELQINVKIPENVKARNLLVQISCDKIFVKMIRNPSHSKDEILVDKKLSKDICESESYWQIEKKQDGSRELVIFLQKDRKQWWTSAFLNDPEIDISKINKGKETYIENDSSYTEQGQKTLLEETNTFLLDSALSSSYLMNKLTRQHMVNTLLV